MRVSLIMTTYNCREQFQKSVESALAQDYPDLELVVVDGGSKDGTVEEIKALEARLADQAKCAAEVDEYGSAEATKKATSASLKKRTMRWVSEPDKGIYDGMNKGIRMATGDVIAVFNDLFTCRDAISKLMKALEDAGAGDPENLTEGGRTQPRTLGVHADLAYMEGNTCKRYWHMGQGNLHFGWMPAHPTLYLKREVYEKYGLYDLAYHSSSDYEFMIRMLRDGSVKLAYVPEVLLHMFWGGTSNGGLMGYPRNVWEAYTALIRNHVAFPLTAIVCRIVRTFGQYRKAEACPYRPAPENAEEEQS